MNEQPLPQRIAALLPPQVDIDAATATYRALHQRWGPNCIFSHQAVESITRSIAMLGLYQRVLDQLRDASQQRTMQRIMRRQERLRCTHTRYLDQWERDRIRDAKPVSDVGYPFSSCSCATLPPPLSDVG